MNFDLIAGGGGQAGGQRRDYLNELPGEMLESIVTHLSEKEKIFLYSMIGRRQPWIRNQAIAENVRGSKSALYWACEKGDVALLNRMVEYGVDVDTVFGNALQFRFIFDMVGACPFEQIPKGIKRAATWPRTPLSVAAYALKADVVARLLSLGARVDLTPMTHVRPPQVLICDFEGSFFEPIHWLALSMEGRSEYSIHSMCRIAAMMMGHGANPNAVTADDARYTRVTPLSLVMGIDEIPATAARCLLMHGAACVMETGVPPPPPVGITRLREPLEAMMDVDQSAYSYLQDHPDIRKAAVMGDATAAKLFEMTRFGLLSSNIHNLPVIEWLVNKMPSPRKARALWVLLYAGASADGLLLKEVRFAQKHMSCQSRFQGRFTMPSHEFTVWLLLRNGADPNEAHPDTSKRNWTVLHQMCDGYQSWVDAGPLVRLMLHHGADPNAVAETEGYKGAESVFDLALYKGRKDVLAALHRCHAKMVKGLG